MHNIVRSLIIAGAASTVLTMGVAPASAKICKSTIITGVSTGILTEAKAFARAQWSKNVKTQYGPAWSLWSLAKTKYFYNTPHDPSLKIVRITMHAVPCKAEFKIWRPFPGGVYRGR